MAANFFHLIMEAFLVEIHVTFYHFTEIHRSSLEKVEQILNRPITKFYNSDDVNASAAELRQPKTRPISL